MAEVISGERVSLPLGLTCTVTPAVQALRQTASALPHAPAGTCAGCRRAWPCDPAHLAASALGAG